VIRGAKGRVLRPEVRAETLSEQSAFFLETKGFLGKGAASKGGPARYQTPIEAACADRRIERCSFSRDYPVL
jgi:hypothetical protein